MDRSFLSDAAVIAASRKFVCVRPLSYENKEEMEFLKTFGAGKSGEVENTVLCFFAPDGKRRLTRAVRGPQSLFAGPNQMAQGMEKIAAPFETKSTDVPGELPFVSDVRLGLNVAACDRQPLLLLTDSDPKAVEIVRTLLWSKDFIGKFIVARASARDLEGYTGADAKAALLIVQPDRFGIKGQVLHQLVGPINKERIGDALTTGLTRHAADDRNLKGHIQAGRLQGIFWDTPLPVKHGDDDHLVCFLPV